MRLVLKDKNNKELTIEDVNLNDLPIALKSCGYEFPSLLDVYPIVQAKEEIVVAKEATLPAPVPAVQPIKHRFYGTGKKSQLAHTKLQRAILGDVPIKSEHTNGWVQLAAHLCGLVVKEGTQFPHLKRHLRGDRVLMGPFAPNKLNRIVRFGDNLEYGWQYQGTPATIQAIEKMVVLLGRPLEMHFVWNEADTGKGKAMYPGEQGILLLDPDAK